MIHDEELMTTMSFWCHVWWYKCLLAFHSFHSFHPCLVPNSSSSLWWCQCVYQWKALYAHGKQNSTLITWIRSKRGHAPTLLPLKYMLTSLQRVRRKGYIARDPILQPLLHVYWHIVLYIVSLWFSLCFASCVSICSLFPIFLPYLCHVSEV